jgi:hypothetical protein
MKRIWILYDSRACGGVGTGDASVLVACDSNKEAKSYKGKFGGMACYSYEVNGKILQDQKWEWDYFD